MMLLVIAYDVANDRRRVRLHTALLGYGTAVQESLFECIVNERQKRSLQNRVRRIIRPADKLRYYSLCEDCQRRTEDEKGEHLSDDQSGFFV